MIQHPFIFSNERKYRIGRHLAFWGFWLLFQAFLYAFVPTPNPIPLSYAQRMPLSMLDSLMYMPTHIFLSYMLMYFVIPFYIVKNKYLAGASWAFVIIIATGAMAALISLYLLNPIREFFLSDRSLLPRHSNYQSTFYLALLAGLRGGLTIGGLAAAIKLMKIWFVEGQRNLQLQKENIESQLQLLKAQVHPHFLFNTLNNIYSFTQSTSPAASKLVMGLSDILRYMLYECKQSLVLFSKELKMTEEYIQLEQIRYGNKLELHIDVPEDTEDLYIAPLLLLPFIENCFKHGTSNILENPWLNLHISIQENVMTMKLLNGKSDSGKPFHIPGIGIENARRRLELLYPNKHELVINSEEEVFIVNLKLVLEKRKAVSMPVIQEPLLVNA